MAGPSTKLRVLYIAGYGRSGSTLLDMALGQHPRIAGAGEITTFSRHVWPNDEYCACRERVHVCGLWSGIGREWTAGVNDADLKAYAAFQNSAEAIVSPARMLGGRRFDAYARRTVDLLRLISSHTGREIVVDSSKLPGRAMALARMPEIDLSVVHLVRDGCGVAWSMQRSYGVDARAGLQKPIVPKSALRTGLRWSFVNMAAEALGRRLGRERYLRVRYEDFVADPAAMLLRIGSMLDIDMEAVAADLNAGRPIASAHQVAGSRLRMGRPVRLAHDEAWRNEMPIRTQRLFDSVAGTLRRRYGYIR